MISDSASINLYVRTIDINQSDPTALTYMSLSYTSIDTSILIQTGPDRWKIAINSYPGCAAQYFIEIDGKLFLHREDGPAYIPAIEDRFAMDKYRPLYYINGIQCTERDVRKRIKNKFIEGISDSEIQSMYEL